MASCTRLALSRTPRQLFLQCSSARAAPPRSFRSLTTSARITARLLPRQPHFQSNGKNVGRQLRQFSRTAARRIESQEAPNAQAYLNSGAISGARDLVDVKKVLVIGSGGLSIGQAGEFDYSGQFCSPS